MGDLLAKYEAEKTSRNDEDPKAGQASNSIPAKPVEKALPIVRDNGKSSKAAALETQPRKRGSKRNR